MLFIELLNISILISKYFKIKFQIVYELQFPCKISLCRKSYFFYKYWTTQDLVILLYFIFFQDLCRLVRIFRFDNVNFNYNIFIFPFQVQKMQFRIHLIYRQLLLKKHLRWDNYRFVYALTATTETSSSSSCSSL